jgi:hypothetical protein
VAGCTLGSLGRVTNEGGSDMFVSWFDSSGDQLWIQQVGSSEIDEAWAVGVNGNLNVVGSTFGSIASGTANAGGSDIFAVQYTQSGSQNWIVQFGSSGYEETARSGVDSNGTVYCAGYTSGVLPSRRRQERRIRRIFLPSTLLPDVIPGFVSLVPQGRFPPIP